MTKKSTERRLESENQELRELKRAYQQLNMMKVRNDYLEHKLQQCFPLWSFPAFRIVPDIISDRLSNDFPLPETSDFQPKTIIGKIGAEPEMTAWKYALVVLSGFEQGANVDFMAVVDDNGVVTRGFRQSGF